MEIKAKERFVKDYYINNSPVGRIEFTKDNKISHIDIYSDWLESEKDFKELLEFINIVKEYAWEEE